MFTYQKRHVLYNQYMFRFFGEVSNDLKHGDG